MNQKGFKFLVTRNLNQDPVENFFGNIRSHGVRNINPTCQAFVNSFKTLIVNNFHTTHSPNFNCEDDTSGEALSSLRNFLACDQSKSQKADCNEPDLHNFSFKPSSDLALFTHTYIAGYIAKQIFRKIGSCQKCRTELVTNTSTYQQTLINARAYTSKALLRPHTNFVEVFTKCNEILHHFLPTLCHEDRVKEKILITVDKLVNNIFHCQKHNIFRTFVNLFVNFYIYMWCKNVNRILKGEDSRNINDSIKVAARQFFEKNCKKNVRIRNVKQLQ